jgi:hypothetical protein
METRSKKGFYKETAEKQEESKPLNTEVNEAYLTKETSDTSIVLEVLTCSPPKLREEVFESMLKKTWNKPQF